MEQTVKKKLSLFPASCDVTHVAFNPTIEEKKKVSYFEN